MLPCKSGRVHETGLGTSSALPPRTGSYTTPVNKDPTLLEGDEAIRDVMMRPKPKTKILFPKPRVTEGRECP
jgi:hypothetical protein